MGLKYENFKLDFIQKSKDFVENYDIDNANKDALKIILSYFAGIDTKNYPLTKGLLIRGFYGSGKTMTLKIIQKLISGLAINNSRDIVADFNINGFDGIESYIKTKTRVFDDIGQENNGKYYGNETNVIQELIIRRYEQFQNKGLITHFTTNEGNNQLKGRYGDRAFDRLKEMCSIVILGDNKISRRDTYNPVNKDKKEIKKVIDEEKANKESIINFLKKIYDGEELFNAMYVDSYNYLKKKEILLLSESRRNEITKLAEKQLILDRQSKIDKLTGSGNLIEARNHSKKLFDIKCDIVAYQKKIAVIQFIKDCKEMEMTIEEILNEES